MTHSFLVAGSILFLVSLLGLTFNFFLYFNLLAIFSNRKLRRNLFEIAIGLWLSLGLLVVYQFRLYLDFAHLPILINALSLVIIFRFVHGKSATISFLTFVLASYFFYISDLNDFVYLLISGSFAVFFGLVLKKTRQTMRKVCFGILLLVDFFGTYALLLLGGHDLFTLVRIVNHLINFVWFGCSLLLVIGLQRFVHKTVELNHKIFFEDGFFGKVAFAKREILRYVIEQHVNFAVVVGFELLIIPENDYQINQATYVSIRQTVFKRLAAKLSHQPVCYFKLEKNLNACLLKSTFLSATSVDKQAKTQLLRRVFEALETEFERDHGRLQVNCFSVLYGLQTSNVNELFNILINGLRFHYFTRVQHFMYYDKQVLMSDAYTGQQLENINKQVNFGSLNCDCLFVGFLANQAVFVHHFYSLKNLIFDQQTLFRTISLDKQALFLRYLAYESLNAFSTQDLIKKPVKLLLLYPVSVLNKATGMIERGNAILERFHLKQDQIALALLFDIKKVNGSVVKRHVRLLRTAGYLVGITNMVDYGMIFNELQCDFLFGEIDFVKYAQPEKLKKALTMIQTAGINLLMQ